MIITIGSVLPDDKGNEYKVIDSIKPGGFGQVFLCERTSDRKKFALKAMLSVFPSSEEYMVFKNELQSAKEIAGANIIKYEYMHDGNLNEGYPPYIIMEYADQGSLAELIEHKKKENNFFTNDELVDIFIQLSTGMASICEVLVHRDIKPENILIKDNILKITDFGLAKYSEATTRNITFKGYGTQPYCAPEVWKNEKNTILMDIYSMGIVFYELATLNYPYSVKNNDFKEAHLFAPVENPKIYNKNLPPNLVSIIIRMLQKQKSKRFSNWQDIIEMLNTENIGISKDIFSLAQRAVEMQNAKDSAVQRKQTEIEKKNREWEEHVKNIMFHFDDVILSSLKEYIDSYNSQYAQGNIQLNLRAFKITSRRNAVTITMPNSQVITVELSVINSEDFCQTIGYNEFNGFRTPTAKKYTYPVCNNKKVLAWGKIEDDHNIGYNILLLDNGIDEYGDWFVLYNKNSGFSRKARPEPFAFSEKELPREIQLIRATHIYSSIVEKYNINRFQELITMGNLYN